MSVKIIANYLPQYHETPYNNEWWGEGFTDWVSVKNAKQVCEGIKQPKIPLGGHYYSLDDAEEIRHQADLAKTYGIYGFGIYHYWFSSKQCLLDIPVRLLIENKDIDMPFMLIWDNVSWKRSWDAVRFSNDWAPLYENGENKKNGMLAELIYGGEEEWKKHFDYLLPIMADERYIKENNKPVFALFNQDNEPEILCEMFAFWRKEAIKHGFAGIEIWGKKNNRNICVADKEFLYEPHEHGWINHNLIQKICSRLNRKLPKLYDYDAIWKKIIDDAERNSQKALISGAFVNYDDTPRRGKKSRIVRNGNCGKFEDYMRKLIEITKRQEKEYIFLTAWNEWGEGAYLEPDMENGYGYLQAIRSALED